MMAAWLLLLIEAAVIADGANDGAKCSIKDSIMSSHPGLKTHIQHLLAGWKEDRCHSTNEEMFAAPVCIAGFEIQIGVFFEYGLSGLPSASDKLVKLIDAVQNEDLEMFKDTVNMKLTTQEIAYLFMQHRSQDLVDCQIMVVQTKGKINWEECLRTEFVKFHEHIAPFMNDPLPPKMELKDMSSAIRKLCCHVGHVMSVGLLDMDSDKAMKLLGPDHYLEDRWGEEEKLKVSKCLINAGKLARDGLKDLIRFALGSKRGGGPELGCDGDSPPQELQFECPLMDRGDVNFESSCCYGLDPTNADLRSNGVINGLPICPKWCSLGCTFKGVDGDGKCFSGVSIDEPWNINLPTNPNPTIVAEDKFPSTRPQDIDLVTGQIWADGAIETHIDELGSPGVSPPDAALASPGSTEDEAAAESDGASEADAELAATDDAAESAAADDAVNNDAIVFQFVNPREGTGVLYDEMLPGVLDDEMLTALAESGSSFAESGVSPLGVAADDVRRRLTWVKQKAESDFVYRQAYMDKNCYPTVIAPSFQQGFIVQPAESKGHQSFNTRAPTRGWERQRDEIVNGADIYIDGDTSPGGSIYYRKNPQDAWLYGGNQIYHGSTSDTVMLYDYQALAFEQAFELDGLEEMGEALGEPYTPRSL